MPKPRAAAPQFIRPSPPCRAPSLQVVASRSRGEAAAGYNRQAAGSARRAAPSR